MPDAKENARRSVKLAQSIRNAGRWLDESLAKNPWYGRRIEWFKVSVAEGFRITARHPQATAGAAVGAGCLARFLAVLIAALLLLTIAFVAIAPLFTDRPTTRTVDTVRDPLSEENLTRPIESPPTATPPSQSEEVKQKVFQSGGAYPGMMDELGDTRPRITRDGSRALHQLDEAALQDARMKAMSRSIDEYNEMVEKHRELYQQHGINPCTSGFFPQGCTKQR